MLAIDNVIEVPQALVILEAGRIAEGLWVARRHVAPHGAEGNEIVAVRQLELKHADGNRIDVVQRIGIVGCTGAAHSHASCRARLR